MPLDLKRLLGREAHDLNFFQAVYLVEKIFPESGKIGGNEELRREPLRFATFNSLSFPPGEIAAMLAPLSLSDQLLAAEKERSPKRDADSESLLAGSDPIGEARAKNMPVRMELTFMGLYGVSSPLPSYFIDPITLRKVEYFQLKKFLDIFGHRFYSLFYQAWKKYRHPLQFHGNGGDDYTQRLIGLTGQWPATASSKRTQLPPPGQTAEFAARTLGLASLAHDLRRLPFARFLGNRVRSAKGLEQLLRGYFAFSRVKVKEFVSQRVLIPMPATLGSSGTTLGGTMRLGETMEDPISRFEIEIGPLDAAELPRFLPPDEARTHGKAVDFSSGLAAEVKNLIDTYLRDPFDYGVTVLVRPPVKAGLGLGGGEFLLGMGTYLDSHKSLFPLRLRF